MRIYEKFLLAPALLKALSSENIIFQESFAFANSYSDLNILEMVGNPVAVNPERELYQVAFNRRTGYCFGFDRDVDRKRNLRSRKRYLMDDRDICYGIRHRFRDRERLFASPKYYRRGYGQHIGYPDRDYSEEPPTEADREYYQKGKGKLKPYPLLFCEEAL